MIRKTITVTEQQNDWIKAEMAQGGTVALTYLGRSPAVRCHFQAAI